MQEIHVGKSGVHCKMQEIHVGKLKAYCCFDLKEQTHHEILPERKKERKTTPTR